ncbi:DUF2238 domain-containing protein [Paenisporosarcina antarctica]|uniref:DUF2238 domain-containing protein n=1 Tax=Paenisporosarcina antarctica TaxID=417367 RepID=A0A4P7A1E4_9BACL|nr:DUF2238 domain-containing protein [Paenisporosarcina antarctica]QBP42424.1 DUF2238 domain-containing protein [Paenisporosarcina antarctica]
MDLGTSSKINLSLLTIVTIVLIWSAYKPAEYLTWIAEVGPSVVVIIIAIVTYNRFRLTVLSYFIVAILSILTFIGGHYTYDDVPLFNWIENTFDLQRNHYDRFGHFLKGLGAIVVREILIRNTQLTKGAWLFSITTSIMLAVAAFYEIIEWLSTKFTNGEEGTKEFLGMQGDIWDAQWDMTFALVGSIIALLIFSRQHDKLLKKLRDS